MTVALSKELELDAADSVVPRVLLVGRPNCGKSSLFNAVSGGHARVGNFPGVTVDVLTHDVQLPGGGSARLVDLPGTYSLEAHVDPESDEGHARATIERARRERGPVVVAQVLDSTNLALNLRLTRELLRLDLPLVLLVTQRDVLESEGRKLDVALLERTLGVPAVWVSARGADTKAVVLGALDRLLSRPREHREVPEFEPTELAASAVLAPGAARVDGRLKLFKRTAAIDRWLMHPLLGPVAFLGLMAALFTAVFLVADPASAVVGAGVDLLTRGIQAVLGTGAFSRFLCEGVIGGAGTVVQFLPQIVLLTVALELVEASGYLARGAYLVDRLLALLGMGGRSFVPLLMGHACAVPAITATRTIRDPRQRLKTILVIPLMTCSARIPAYALLIATFFPGLNAGGRAVLFLTLYALGLVMGAVASLVIGRSVLRNKKSMPLVLELPPYRAPQPKVVARAAWRAGSHFLRDVGTTIVAVSAALWVLLSVPVGKAPAQLRPDVPERTQVMSRSVAAEVGKALEPITRPVGFDWRINVALIGSFGARELMVSTMGVIFGIENADADHVGGLPDEIRNATTGSGAKAYSMATGLALLAFFLLACQCMSTLSAVRRETHGWRWPAFLVAYTYAAAYAAAFLVFHGARLFGL